MFKATFHAWKYGPVLPEIRQLYKADALKRELPKEQEEQYNRPPAEGLFFGGS